MYYLSYRLPSFTYRYLEYINYHLLILFIISLFISNSSVFPKIKKLMIKLMLIVFFHNLFHDLGRIKRLFKIVNLWHHVARLVGFLFGILLSLYIIDI